MYCNLFTSVMKSHKYLQRSCPSDYTTHIHHAFIIIFETRHTGLIMAALNVLVKLLPSSPFLLSPCSSLAFTTFFLPPVLISIFSISWAMLAVSISFCNLDFMGCNVFDIRSGHIYFQGQYSLYFFPFVCSIFLLIFFALVVFVFSAFLVIIFLQPLPGFQSYKGV